MSRATAVPGGTLWVCTCCLMAREGDGCDGQHEHEREPWAREPGTDVTLGMAWSEHEDPPACQAGWEAGEPCECDRLTFSWRSCEGCGSTLGGERHAYTWWHDTATA